MKTILRLPIIAIALLLCSIPLKAQHTAQGQMHMSLHLDYPSSNSLGTGISLGQYLGSGYWMAGIDAQERMCVSTVTGNLFSYAHAYAHAGYMFRIFATRSRKTNVYCGGSVLLGAEFNDPFTMLPSGEAVMPTPDSYAESIKFLYGVMPAFELEQFIWSKWAVVFSARVAVPIETQYQKYYCLTGAGIRYNF